MLEREYARARVSFEETLALRERILGQSHPLTAEGRADVASADFALGAIRDSLSSALDAERVGRDHLRFTIRYLPERQALAYAARRPRGLDLAMSIVAAGKVSDPAAVVDLAIQSRAVVLDELGARAHAAAETNDPAIASLSSSVVLARERFATLMLRSFQGEDSVPRALLEQARREKEEAEETLAERSMSARAELARTHIGLEDVRRALPAESALVSFVRYDRTICTSTESGNRLRTVPSYLAFVVGPESTQIDVVPLGPSTSIEAAVSMWHEEARGRSITPLNSLDAQRTYRTVAARLRARVWDPLIPHLHGATRVFVVPDGALNLVSFVSLPTGPKRYLLDDGPVIQYLSTERDLVLRDAVPPSHGLLAVGGPDFEGTTQLTRTATRRFSQGCGTLGELRFEPLPGSKSEVLDIARLWPASTAGANGNADTLVLTGRAATEGAVKDNIVGRRIVHLATHGFFVQSRCDVDPSNARAVGAIVAAPSASMIRTENPLLLSGLAFAGANRRTASASARDDGILTAEEVAGLNLQGTEWAVLSACDTGAGEIKAGEGVFGLRRAFQIAGARTIIMSLWSVDDRATVRWMHALYEARLQKHLDTPDAIHYASAQVLQHRRDRGESTHPFYWAGFVAAGDWR